MCAEDRCGWRRLCATRGASSGASSRTSSAAYASRTARRRATTRSAPVSASTIACSATSLPAEREEPQLASSQDKSTSASTHVCWKQKFTHIQNRSLIFYVSLLFFCKSRAFLSPIFTRTKRPNCSKKQQQQHQQPNINHFISVYCVIWKQKTIFICFFLSYSFHFSLSHLNDKINKFLKNCCIIMI